MDFSRKKAKKDAKNCESAIRLQESHSFLESPFNPLHQNSSYLTGKSSFFAFFGSFLRWKIFRNFSQSSHSRLNGVW